MSFIKRAPLCQPHFNGLAYDCGNSTADALELPQSSTEPSIPEQMQTNTLFSAIKNKAFAISIH